MTESRFQLFFSLDISVSSEQKHIQNTIFVMQFDDITNIFVVAFIVVAFKKTIMSHSGKHTSKRFHNVMKIRNFNDKS